MTRWLVALLLGAVGLMTAAPPPAPGADTPGLGANAALKYWQAFAQLPTLDEAQQKRLGEWNTKPVDADARKLLAATGVEVSLKYLRRGDALPRCDWSLDYEDGIGLLLPHLGRARTLAAYAALRSRQAAADGRPADGLDDALAVFALGRHVADPIMISLLVDYAVEHVAIDATAQLLPKLDGAALRRVAERLDALPPAATLEQAFDAEQKYFSGWAIRWLKDLERSGVKDMRAKVRAMLVGSEDAEEVMKLVDDASAARLIQALEALGPFFEEQRRLAGMPRDQFLGQWPAAQQKQSANAVARVMLPATTKVVDARDRYRARFAMLKAAVAVVRDGQAALAKHPDPFGSGPFEHKALPQGFELRSKLTLEGKPVTLTVGSPEK
jgi:hypothetical protein